MKPADISRDFKLDGERIYLRKLRLSDAESFFTNIKDLEISLWSTNIPYPYPKERAKRFIRKTHRRLKANSHSNLGIVLKSSEKVIGTVGINNIDWEKKDASLGYWIGKRYWGKGLAQEALQLAMTFAKEELKLKNIFANVIDQNTRSMGVLKKNGFQKKAVQKKAKKIRGKWYAVHCYVKSLE
jgi:RimJ/RimL family protein N-acetyltransferase